MCSHEVFMVLVFRGPVFPAAFETPGPWSHPVSAWFEARRWNENHFSVWIGACGLGSSYCLPTRRLGAADSQDSVTCSIPVPPIKD